MSPEDQRIAIAKHEGWSRIFKVTETHPWGVLPDESWGPLPDYLNDHNAINKAVLAQDNLGFKLRYVSWLELIVLGRTATHKERDSSTGRFALYNASAAQCCEAFLRAHDLWVESRNEKSPKKPVEDV